MRARILGVLAGIALPKNTGHSAPPPLHAAAEAVEARRHPHGNPTQRRSDAKNFGANVYGFSVCRFTSTNAASAAIASRQLSG